MPEKKKYDMNSSEAKAVIDEIVHGTFMTEGTMVAFPPCFPGVTTPIPMDECHITAMDITPDGIVYGGTSGRKSHLFVGMFHGVTGIVFDLGIIEGMSRCTSVCCCHGKVIAAGKGPKGDLLVSTDYQGLPFDLIQEWGFSRNPIKTIAELPKGDGDPSAVACMEGKGLLCQSGGHLLRLEVEGGNLTEIGLIPGDGPLLKFDQGTVYGFDEGRTLWRYHTDTNALERKVFALPEGCQVGDTLKWACAKGGSQCYLADTAGALFPFTPAKGFGASIGKARLAPVGAMAITHDGRLVGACGDGIGRFFVYSPREGQVRDIGVAVSIIESRRYGYQFGAAVTGRDGEIYFGENDNNGHLWIYFPRIEKSNI